TITPYVSITFLSWPEGQFDCFRCGLVPLREPPALLVVLVALSVPGQAVCERLGHVPCVVLAKSAPQVRLGFVEVLDDVLGWALIDGEAHSASFPKFFHLCVSVHQY